MNEMKIFLVVVFVGLCGFVFGGPTDPCVAEGREPGCQTKLVPVSSSSSSLSSSTVGDGDRDSGPAPSSSSQSSSTSFDNGRGTDLEQVPVRTDVQYNTAPDGEGREQNYETVVLRDSWFGDVPGLVPFGDGIVEMNLSIPAFWYVSEFHETVSVHADGAIAFGTGAGKLVDILLNHSGNDFVPINMNANLFVPGILNFLDAKVSYAIDFDMDAIHQNISNVLYEFGGFYGEEIIEGNLLVIWEGVYGEPLKIETALLTVENRTFIISFYYTGKGIVSINDMSGGFWYHYENSEIYQPFSSITQMSRYTNLIQDSYRGIWIYEFTAPNPRACANINCINGTCVDFYTEGICLCDPNTERINDTSCGKIPTCTECSAFSTCGIATNFRCICDDGSIDLHGNGNYCIFDDCKLNPCSGNLSTCYNREAPDDYICSCPSPLSYNDVEGECDINECEHENLSKCSMHATCENFIGELGTFQCTCNEDYFGTGTVCVKPSLSVGMNPEDAGILGWILRNYVYETSFVKRLSVYALSIGDITTSCPTGVTEYEALPVVCNGDGRILSINLENLDLQTTLPENINLLTKLRYLRLENCTISGEIPRIFRNLAIEYLNLNSNMLNGEIEFIGSMTYLKKLHLESNNFRSCFPSAEPPRISECNLGNNNWACSSICQYPDNNPHLGTSKCYSDICVGECGPMTHEDLNLNWCHKWFPCIDECHDSAYCALESNNCACQPLFDGDGLDCETDCNCGENSYCVRDVIPNGNLGPIQWKYGCNCLEGFRKPIGDLSANYCEDACDGSCSPSQSCYPTPMDGIFECRCATGYTLKINSTLCIDIDECNMKDDNGKSVKVCSKEEVCTNTEGGYQCSCGAGFEKGTYGCYDINECKTLITQKNGVVTASPGYKCDINYDACINTIGSYNCISIDDLSNNEIPIGNITLSTTLVLNGKVYVRGDLSVKGLSFKSNGSLVVDGCVSVDGDIDVDITDIPPKDGEEVEIDLITSNSNCFIIDLNGINLSGKDDCYDYTAKEKRTAGTLSITFVATQKDECKTDGTLNSDDRTIIVLVVALVSVTLVVIGLLIVIFTVPAVNKIVFPHRIRDSKGNTVHNR